MWSKSFAVQARRQSLAVARSAQEKDDLAFISELYADFAGEGGAMLTSVLVKLAVPDPMDLDGVDLAEYKGIAPPWNEWAAVVEQRGALAAEIGAP